MHLAPVFGLTSLRNQERRFCRETHFYHHVSLNAPMKLQLPQSSNAHETLSEEMKDETTSFIQSAVTLPEFQSAFSVISAFDDGSMDLGKLLNQFRHAADAVNNGNLDGPERMAMCQAKILDLLFHELLRRGMALVGQPDFEIIMKLALKAQAQSAKALETIAVLKKPAIFAKQLNLANQQVVTNNHPTTPHLAESATPPPTPAAIDQQSSNLVRLAGKRNTVHLRHAVE